MPKKRKAIKITDRRGNKAWLKKVAPSSYKVESVDPNKLILIVGEGQTEKIYFESFPVLTLTVEVIDLGGQSKVTLIESTDEIIRTSDKTYDEVWCVFDMDVNRGEKEYQDFDNAITQGHARGYSIAYSNDSFELWFYLHYNYTDQQHLRDFYYEALGERWGLNYRKNGKAYGFCLTLYERLQNDKDASQEAAMERACKLFEDQSDLPRHEQNPVTLVYTLVEVLKENMRK